MKIVKGDTVYLRSGRDVADRHSRLEEALGADDRTPQARAQFQERIKSMPMAEQIAKANDVKGVRGRVIRVLPKEGKVVVEGLNMVTRHKKPTSTGGAASVQSGGRIKMEAPIPVSRVMLVCSQCDKPTRVKMQEQTATRKTQHGDKQVTVRVRVCKQCGQVIDRPTDIAAQV